MALTASSRLEVLQTYKLLQCVRHEDTSQINKLCAQGMPMLINYRDPQRGECALHLAAQINNHAITKFLVNLGAYPNVKDCLGRTPLMRAADYGHDKSVATLVEAGADLKIRDDLGHDVIYYCFSSSTDRHKKCLDIVMSKGADPNNTVDSDEPTLVAACQGGPENEDICLELIKRGADPNSQNKINGKTALAEACSSRNLAVARELLLKGADPNIADKRKWTPLHYASEIGSLDVVKVLLAYGADVTAVEKELNSALHFAAEGGFGMICKYLAQRGCNPKDKNEDGFTPRLLAKEKNSKEASKELRKAEKLFAKFSKPDAINPNGVEVLHLYDWVCEREDYVKQALMKGVSKVEEEESEKKENNLTQQSFIDIMEQIKAPVPKIVQSRILEAHEKEGKKIVNIEEFLSGKKYVSKTYLMSAFEGKKKKGKKGKKGGKKGKKGKLKIPLPICLDKDGPRRPDGGPPVKYLERQLQWMDATRFGRDTPPLHPLQDDSDWYLQQPTKQYISITDAVRFEDFETLKQAFESGIDVDSRDKYFKTPMMASCAEGNIELTHYLLSLGASVEARDNFKWTPLHHACHSGQLDVVKILLYAGADGNAVTWNGATPLMRAVESGKTELVRFLLDCNVSVSFRNKKDKDVLDVAKEWGNADIYELVKEKVEAAPKAKKDKKGNMKQPPLQPLTLPELKIGLPSIFDLEKTNNFHSNILTESPHIQNIFLRNSNRSEPDLDFPKQRRTVIDFTMQQYRNTDYKIKREKIAFRTRKTLFSQSSRKQLMDEKERKRIRFGEAIDFENYQKPLKQNINELVKDVETETM